MRHFKGPTRAPRVAASRRRARWAENLLIVAILGALGAWAATAGTAAVRDVRTSEVVVAFLGPKIDSIERFALSGRWLETGEGLSPSGGTELAGGGSVADEIGREFRRNRPVASMDPTPGPWPAPARAPIQQVQLTAVRQGVVNGALVVMGRYGEGSDTFSWTLRPAVLAESPPMVVAWICGNGQPGARWLAPPPLDWPDLRSAAWCRAEGLR